MVIIIKFIYTILVTIFWTHEHNATGSETLEKKKRITIIFIIIIKVWERTV